MRPPGDTRISSWKTSDPSDQAACKQACIENAACRAVTVLPRKSKKKKGFCSLWSTECTSQGKNKDASSFKLKMPCNGVFMLNAEKTACVGEWD